MQLLSMTFLQVEHMLSDRLMQFLSTDLQNVKVKRYVLVIMHTYSNESQKIIIFSQFEYVNKAY